MAGYKFQTMGEYRALLSLYNVTVEEARGMVDGREYHGLVYSATDDTGNKDRQLPSRLPASGSPSAMKPCSAGLNTSKEQIRDRRLAETTRNVPSPPRLPGHTAKRGVRHPSPGEGRGCGVPPHRRRAHLRGDLHRPPHGLRAERFASWAGSFPPMPCRSISPCRMPALRPYRSPSPWTRQQPDTRPAVEYDEGYSSGLGLLGGDASGAQAEEAAFERNLRRRRKKAPQGTRDI